MEHTNPVSQTQINQYLDKRLTAPEVVEFEKKIKTCEVSKNIFEKTLREKEFLGDLIPEPKLTAHSQELLSKDLKDITGALLNENSVNPVKKIIKFLNKPILEF